MHELNVNWVRSLFLTCISESDQTSAIANLIKGRLLFAGDIQTIPSSPPVIRFSMGLEVAKESGLKIGPGRYFVQVSARQFLSNLLVLKCVWVTRTDWRERTAVFGTGLARYCFIIAVSLILGCSNFPATTNARDSPTAKEDIHAMNQDAKYYKEFVQLYSEISNETDRNRLEAHMDEAGRWRMNLEFESGDLNLPIAEQLWSILYDQTARRHEQLRKNWAGK